MTDRPHGNGVLPYPAQRECVGQRRHKRRAACTWAYTSRTALDDPRRHCLAVEPVRNGQESGHSGGLPSDS